jgi:NADH dehydrogenase [ubiquinone] 1 alpha subcomplex assembly factor 7
VSGLADHLRRRIALEGPLTVAAYMTDALCHPRFGYYIGRDPLGAAGSPRRRKSARCSVS